MTTTETKAEASDASATDASTFEKPGPGTWELDASHYAADCSRIAQQLISQGCTQGTRAGLELMGGPIDTLEVEFVHGYMYRRMVPLIGGDRDLPTPPNPVLWAVTRLHPTFRRREKTAADALESRVWMDEYRRWEDEWKPQLIERNRSFTEIDPAPLSDQELADHLSRLSDHLTWSTTLHFRLHASDLGPIGRLLVNVREWGIDPRAAMTALAGSSPATSAPAEVLTRLRRLVADSGANPTDLDDVRRISAEVSSLLDDVLTEYGWRLTTGYDLQDLTFVELPDVVLASVTADPDSWLAADDAAARATGAAAFDELRRQVPTDRHEEFDELVADARALYGLRDENGPLTYEWPAGVLRRAMLEAADRLVVRGRIHAHDHVFDLSATELVDVVRGADQPTPDELADRCANRRAQLELEAPRVLGRAETPPPAWVLPGALSELMETIVTVLELLEAPDSGLLVGTGVGSGSYTGRACVVADADDALERMEPGDVLVARFTVPTFNTVLAMAGAVVVEHGGLLCHAAVIARELGIPGVVGAAAATTAIPDGATVEVDPVTGTVSVVSST